mmetsp:Transcript_17382/g.45386  ORF Transcript_17382/g.45386 Transcript_17382/m.45386 type:complete len:198 (+) Transcript_17382:45-638(+)
MRARGPWFEALATIVGLMWLPMVAAAGSDDDKKGLSDNEVTALVVSWGLVTLTVGAGWLFNAATQPGGIPGSRPSSRPASRPVSQPVASRLVTTASPTSPPPATGAWGASPGGASIESSNSRRNPLYGRQNSFKRAMDLGDPEESVPSDTEVPSPPPTPTPITTAAAATSTPAARPGDLDEFDGFGPDEEGVVNLSV